jgi:hypothetical protein
MKAIDKWDGNLSNVTSGAVPFISAGGNGRREEQIANQRLIPWPAVGISDGPDIFRTG